MGDVLPFDSFDKYFRALGRRGRMVRLQQLLSVTMLLVVILAELFRPGCSPTH